MPNNIHGHKVLELLSQQPLTRDELKVTLLDTYGEDVLFHTCKSDGLDFDTLFDFFIEREKVALVDGKYTDCRENRCQH